jgi:insertion element IS1 protein InsB
VGHKGQQAWVALERQTWRVAGLALGIVRAKRVANFGRPCHLTIANARSAYSDFWEPYALVLYPSGIVHLARSTWQGDDETAHVEHFNNTLRQRGANLVSKTLSFSKDNWWHKARISLFIDPITVRSNARAIWYQFRCDHYPLHLHDYQRADLRDRRNAA